MSPESPPIRPLSPRAAWGGFWLVLFVGLLPHVIGSALNIVYNREHVLPMLSPEQRAAFELTWQVFNLAVYPVAFLVWTGALLSLRPTYRRLLRGEPVEESLLLRARQRTLHLPWWAGGLGVAGWLVCIPVLLLTVGGSGPLTPELLWHLPVSLIVSGLVAVTHAWFGVELASQRWMYPVVFRDARPAATPGVRQLGLQLRGLLWVISVGLCPIASLVLLAFAAERTGEGMAWFALAVGAIGALFGLVTAWLVGKAVAEPVLALRRAAERVAAGDLQVHVPLLRADDLGMLIDEFNRLIVELREKERLRQTFGLHVGHEAARQILAQEGLGGSEKEITVMFVDIRGFTARTAAARPEEVVALLNRFLTAMVSVVERRGGWVNKFLGDGFMALFGAGGNPAEHADQAVAATLEMLRRLEEVNAELTREGIAPLVIGIGLHTGRAVVGSIGSPQRREYTAIGDTVNIASRVEGLTKTVGRPALLTAATRAALRDAATPLEPLPPQPVKGQPAPLEVYALQ